MPPSRRINYQKRGMNKIGTLPPSYYGMTHFRYTGKRALYYVVGSKQISRSSRGRHYWVLYVDIVMGDPELLQRVSFRFFDKTIYCNSPIPKVLDDGTRVMRFSTGLQSSKGRVPTTIKLLGMGRTVRHINFAVAPNVSEKRSKARPFRETRKIRPRLFLPMPQVKFGLELELSCANNTPVENIADHISEHANVPVKIEMNYHNVHHTFDGWKLVYDGTIRCSRHSPDCSRFELVAPILMGADGLRECHRVLKALWTSASVTVNKSMGFHVHINVEGFSLQDYIHVCQNFVTYEDVIDTFMPLSRRTGSEESNIFCKSNKAAVFCNNNFSTASHYQCNENIASCQTKNELFSLINPTGRYYKMNMQNLKSGRQPTIEFRQHSATSNYDKIGAWIRFCTYLVYNSRNLEECQQPSNVAITGGDRDFEMLFNNVIKDRALRDVYAKRRDELDSSMPGDLIDECCADCAHGGKCSAALYSV